MSTVMSLGWATKRACEENFVVIEIDEPVIDAFTQTVLPLLAVDPSAVTSAARVLTVESQVTPGLGVAVGVGVAVGDGLAVAVGVAVAVAVAVGVGEAVGVGVAAATVKLCESVAERVWASVTTSVTVFAPEPLYVKLVFTPVPNSVPACDQR
jgi:hypothetical protein